MSHLVQVALLRGVNVNGITITSAALKALIGELGLTGAKTVLASGNVVFTDPETRPTPALKAHIEAGLRQRFGYDAWIVLSDIDRLAAQAAAYPFPRQDEEFHPYLVFFNGEAIAGTELLAVLDNISGDVAVEQVSTGDGVLYWACPRGSSTDTPVAKHLAKAKFKPLITTRNLRTVNKILAAGGSPG